MQTKSCCSMRSYLLMLLAGISFAFLLNSCTESRKKTNPVKENITETVYASGIIKAREQYLVYATTSGIISRFFVKENDSVKRGSPLVLINDQVSQINNINSNLAADFAALSTNRDKLTEQENIIRVAEAKYSNDSLMFVRQQNLWKDGIGSKTDLDQKTLAETNSKNALASAKLKYSDLLKQLKFNEKQGRNNSAITKSKVEDLTIRSRVDGKVYFLSKKEGEMINPQTAIAVIGSSDSFYLELQVDEYDIIRIKEGQRVFISMDSYKGETFEASITKIYPFMNERSKSFTIEAVFVKPPASLYPNLTAEANILIRTKANALTIPRSYLMNDSFVLAEDDRKIKVVTGLKDYQKVEIISGLSANDVIYKR